MMMHEIFQRQMQLIRKPKQLDLCQRNKQIYFAFHMHLYRPAIVHHCRNSFIFAKNISMSACVSLIQYVRVLHTDTNPFSSLQCIEGLADYTDKGSEFRVQRANALTLKHRRENRRIVEKIKSNFRIMMFYIVFNRRL